MIRFKSQNQNLQLNFLLEGQPMYKIKLNAGAWQKCLGPDLLNE